MPGEAQLAAQGATSLIGAVQIISDLTKAGKANRNLSRLFKQRRAFQTPSEIFDIVNAQESNAASGFSPETLQYLTMGANTGLASTLGSATRLGGDPNNFSSILDTYSRGIFSIGKENELVKMKKFDGLMNALQLLASNKEAEWLSEENLIKDQMAAEAQKIGAAEKGVGSGANLLVNSISAFGATDIYDNNNGRRNRRGNFSGGSSTGGDPLNP